ncbi:uncharacterized protein LOC113334122 isoform X2 [Papaver somniferum]|uniref:uncharacterized protein LOC113334122 isoform X2 n=1 Tax=Papaver somniferum TaxID=3469 RepID=UPI000E6F79CB|nr:uncharacterized protein LOC113334122 isoform X2 [Papaver somniferum]
MFGEFDPKYSKYSDAHRDLMEKVLDNWKLRDEEEKFKVLHDYLSDVHINSYFYESTEDLLTELRILKRINCILGADHRELLATYRSGDIEFYKVQKEFFKVKTIMLDFLKSQMKNATISEFLRSLAEFPEEEFSSSQIKDATMLDFLKSLVHLDLPEERKNWLLQKLVGNDITSACEESKTSENVFAEKLQRLGVEIREDNLTNDGDPCTDMDSLKKRLKVMENEVREKSDNLRQMYDCPIHACARRTISQLLLIKEGC